MTRRRVLAAAGAGAVVVGAGAAVASAATPGTAGTSPATATATASSSDGTCYTLTAEQIEGPYYLDYNLVRKDVTEGDPGVPMRLRLKVIDADTCRPLRGAAVDIWHCDALGVYSGYTSNGSGGGSGTPTGTPTATETPTGTPTDVPTGPPPGGGGGGHQEPTDDTTFFRGTQLTDRHGFVEFRTVFPGWYRGRAVHIHTKVKVDGELTEDGYEGGHQCHTGQFYFKEEAVLAVAELEPYSTNTTTRTTLDEDSIYAGGGAVDGLLNLKYDKRHVGRGVLATLTMAVHPDETHDGSDAPQPTFEPPGSASASPSASA